MAGLNSIGKIGDILARAKVIAIEYYKETGKPLGITGEIGEYEVSRLLGLTLAGARSAGFDAQDDRGIRYQIKARSITAEKSRKSQQVGAIKLEHEWDVVLLVLMDELFQTEEIWQAERQIISDTLRKPGSRARNERGAMAVSKFKQIGMKVWPR
jgi:hypothetical protein